MGLPGTVCHLDGGALTLDPATPGHGSVARAGSTHAAAGGALATIVVTWLPWCPRTEATVLGQVPYLQRGF